MTDGEFAMPEKRIGRRHWAIAEGYIPGGSTGPEPAITSHKIVVQHTRLDSCQAELALLSTVAFPGD